MRQPDAPRSCAITEGTAPNACRFAGPRALDWRLVMEASLGYPRRHAKPGFSGMLKARAVWGARGGRAGLRQRVRRSGPHRQSPTRVGVDRAHGQLLELVDHASQHNFVGRRELRRLWESNLAGLGTLTPPTPARSRRRCFVNRLRPDLRWSGFGRAQAPSCRWKSPFASNPTSPRVAGAWRFTTPAGCTRDDPLSASARCPRATAGAPGRARMAWQGSREPACLVPWQWRAAAAPRLELSRPPLAAMPRLLGAGRPGALCRLRRHGGLS